MFCWMQNNQYNLFWDSNSLSFFDIINYFCFSVWLLFCFGIISFCCYFCLSSANLSSLDFVISYSSFCVQNASISFPFCVQRLLHRKLQYFFVCVIIWKGKQYCKTKIVLPESLKNIRPFCECRLKDATVLAFKD